MLNWSSLLKAMQIKLWAEFPRTATDVETLAVKVGKEVPPHKELFGCNIKAVWTLRRFGEIGIAKKGSKIKSKMTNPGVPTLYLGYAEDHAGDVYCLLNLETKMVVFSRDMRWLNQSYHTFAKSQGLEEDNNNDDSDDDNEEEVDVTVDTFNDVNGPNDTEAEDESNRTGGQNSVSWATNLVQPATCSTRSAAKAGRALDQSATSNLNAKQTCELVRLGGTFY
jgi:hypothetical protein